MTKPAYLILLALAVGRKHGYALVGAVGELSGGEIALGAATLYGTLDRLRAAALVDADGEEIVDGRARRYYRLTDSGRAAASEETDRLAALAQRAAAALGTSRGAEAGNTGAGGAVRPAPVSRSAATLSRAARWGAAALAPPTVVGGLR